ncbi:MAG: hypothetical protein HY243_15885 [Proteobacteria bacterium]|nr:hypothetical protein [Pseudomonadota bacterium]
MVQSNHAQRAQHYRNRAEEMRVIATTMKDPGAREAILRLASSYDSMADSLHAISAIIERFTPPSHSDTPPPAQQRRE